MSTFVMKGDLCTYMLQESRVREDAACRRRQVTFTLLAKTGPLGHAVPIVNVHPSHDGTVVTVGEDGVICCWSSELKLQKTKDAFVGFFLKSKKRPKMANTDTHIGFLDDVMQKLLFGVRFLSLVCLTCSVFLNN